MEWEKFENRIVSLLGDFDKFRIRFIDRDDFKRFADSLLTDTSYYNDFRISGYFSEAGYKTIEKIVRRKDVLSVKLISPEPYLKTRRNKRNLNTLRKLNAMNEKIGVKVNYMIHARLFIASRTTSYEGILIIGSFDFNKECLSRERLDAGIKTRNPDLVGKAIEFFDNVWNDQNSIPIEDFKE